MKRFTWLLLLLPMALVAQTVPDRAIPGWCQAGAVKATVSGMSSSNTLQGVIPDCTVTVYLTGTTTKATIHSDSNNTPLSNPFTAADNGQWTIFAQPATAYDIVLSGGRPGNTYAQPLTLTAIQVGGPGAGGATSPGGNNQEVQFNANGFFEGTTGLTWSSTNNALLYPTGAISANLLNAATALTAGTITANSITSNGAINGVSLTATGAVSGASLTATGAINGATVTASGAVSGAALNSIGDMTVGGNLAVTGSMGVVNASTVTATGAINGATVTGTGAITGATLNSTGNATVGGNLAVSGSMGAVNATTVTATTINGPIAPTQVTWPPSCLSGTVYNPSNNSCVATGTGNNPGGTNGQVQFNNGGFFGGNSGFTWNASTGLGVNKLTVTDPSCAPGTVPKSDGSGCATITAVGATGNGLALVSTQTTPSTNATGVNLGGLFVAVLGDSTTGVQTSAINNLSTMGASPGLPLYGMTFRSANGAYTVDASHNLTLTVANTDGKFWINEYVSADVGAGTTTGCITTGGGTVHGQLTAVTSSSVTIGNAVVQSSCSGTITNAGVISPNFFWTGFSGSTIPSLNISQLSASITAMQSMKTVGNPVAFVFRAGINDFRQDTENFPTAWTALQTTLSTVESATGLAGTPFIFVGPNSVNSRSQATNQVCPSGSGTNANCSSTPPAATLSAATTAGAVTVTLTNSSGYTWCPNSIWGGPGMPLEVSSNGNNMQLIVDTVGSGVQETVTVTNVVPVSLTDATHYQCQVSFTAANSHSLGAPVVPTLQWAAQYVTDELWQLQQNAVSLAAIYPGVLSLDLQSVIYGRAAATTLPVMMSDQLHPTTYVEDDAWIGRALGQFVNAPQTIGPRPPIQVNAIGSDTIGELQAQVVLAPKFDGAFTKRKAAAGAQQAGFWRPWEIESQYSSLNCEDENLYQTILVGMMGTGTAVGATTISLSGAYAVAASSVRGGAGTGDIVDVVGIGCISGSPYLSSVAVLNAGVYSNGNAAALTMSAGIPFAIPANTPVLVRRERAYAGRAIPYVSEPGASQYQNRFDANISAGGLNTYTIAGIGGSIFVPLGSSIKPAFILGIGGDPATGAAFVAGHQGTGFNTADTITDACGAIFSVTASAGQVTALNLTATVGLRCQSSTNHTPVSTSGTGTGLQYQIAAGLFTIPAGTTCAGPFNSANTICTDSSGNNYSGWAGKPVTVMGAAATPPDVFGANLYAANKLVLADTATTFRTTTITGCGATTCNMVAATGGQILASGNLNGLTQGTQVLAGGTATVNNANACTPAAATCNYHLTACVAGGTLGILSVGTVVAGTSFVINSSNAGDTSTVCWEIH